MEEKVPRNEFRSEFDANPFVSGAQMTEAEKLLKTGGFSVAEGAPVRNVIYEGAADLNPRFGMTESLLPRADSGEIVAASVAESLEDKKREFLLMQIIDAQLSGNADREKILKAELDKLG